MLADCFILEDLTTALFIENFEFVFPGFFKFLLHVVNLIIFFAEISDQIDMAEECRLEHD